MSALGWRELGAPGAGAIRVLALEGPGALAALAPLAPGRVFRPGTFVLARLRARSGELLDEAVVRVRSAHELELQVHGSAAVVARLLRELGLPPASARARTLEERAEERLAAAESEPAARVLLDQAEGALRREFERLLALDEAQRVPAARALAALGRAGLALVVPRRVVLAGPVNAGKSTLFNALVGRERVVVDAAAGTTRDAVGERVLFGAYPVELIDTAGRRTLAMQAVPEVELERAGQALAEELAAAAELVVELVPPGAVAPIPRADRVTLASRADEGPGPAGLASIAARDDPLGARATLERLFHGALDLPREPWQPGRALPFEPEWSAALGALDGVELTEALERFLAAR